MQPSVHFFNDFDFHAVHKNIFSLDKLIVKNLADRPYNFNTCNKQVNPMAVFGSHNNTIFESKYHVMIVHG